MFYSKSGILSHHRTQSGEKSFKCDQLDKCFAHRKNPFTCDQCYKCFIKKKSYNFRYHTVARSLFKCEQCDGCFVDKKVLL